MYPYFIRRSRGRSKKMKKIIHVDMDYFYAQVEERDRPELKGKPVAIGGMMGGRGVLCTSNYIARKYGVRSAMPTSQAIKLCPNLILIRPNFQKYKEISEEIFDIYGQFSKKIQKLSLDEAYIDVTECKKFNNDAIAIAREIKRRIYGKTRLTASAGVSYNKLLAKIGSDLFKPDGLAILRPENIVHNIAHFPIGKINGVGKVTQKRMAKFGIETFGDMQNYSKLDLINMFGDYGVNLYDYCRGVDHRSVSSSRERKSLSAEHTFSKDYNDMTKLKEKLLQVFYEVEKRLKKHQDKFHKNIFVKIKYSDFQSTTIESQLSFSYENFERLFEKRYLERPDKVRLLGLGVKFFHQDDHGQLSLPLVG